MKYFAYRREHDSTELFLYFVKESNRLGELKEYLKTLPKDERFKDSGFTIINWVDKKAKLYKPGSGIIDSIQSPWCDLERVARCENWGFVHSCKEDHHEI